jgi:DNA polymerase III alpha subunit
VAADLQLLGVSTTRNPFQLLARASAGDGRDAERKVVGARGRRSRAGGGDHRLTRAPATRSGRTAIFISLEDELGLIDVAVFEEAYKDAGGRSTPAR